jgi:hypothetical protein
MINLLLLPFLINSFVQKEYIEYGTSGPNGRVLLGDYNRNGKTDIIFTGYIDIFALGMVLERQDSAIYLMVDTVGFYLAIWDDGDFDSDGLYDVVTDGDYFIGIMIFESPDSFSYPTQEVWRDTVGQPAVTPISVYDIDQDGLPEIVKVGANGIDFVIYESIGDNFYDKIYEDTIQGINTPLSTLGFADFDDDGKIEFVLGNLSDGVGAAYWLYESPADNTYEFIHLGSVPTKNIKDCFSVADADGDGKLEFVVKGFTPLDARTHAFIFEAIGDNTYEIIKSFNLAGGDYYGGYSEAGDVDGDSVPEIVLESASYVYIIKAAGNDSFYIWDTLPGHASGSNVRIFDIDGNGLAEIIISGNNETRIYEYDPGGIEETALRLLPDALRLEVYPNPFKEKITIRYIIQNVGQCFSPANSELEGLPYICIYDVSGRLVKQFDYQTLKLSDQITWKGDDENGRTVAQGVYFLQMENLTSGNAFCRKIIKIK